MSKREAIARYNLIIKKLRKRPAKFIEIADYLALESEIQEYDFNISMRTFQRDRKDIFSIYNIDIQYDFIRKVYYIDQEEQPELNERILEAFDTFNALHLTDRLSNYIHFEKRKPQGTEHLYGLLHAIKNQLQIKFVYQKYWEGRLTDRHVEPFALKEFKNRWDLLAKDLKNEQIKSFALDRLKELEILKKRFESPKNFDVNEHYRHCFGIISQNSDKPADVILSFNPFQGKYIKSLPLHESQVLLTDSDEEVRVRLKLFLTHDFFMELLSFGNDMRVIAPNSLIDELKSTAKNILDMYEE